MFSTRKSVRTLPEKYEGLLVVAVIKDNRGAFDTYTVYKFSYGGRTLHVLRNRNLLFRCLYFTILCGFSLFLLIIFQIFTEYWNCVLEITAVPPSTELPGTQEKKKTPHAAATVSQVYRDRTNADKK